jgi:hypothetical protein
MTFAIIVVVAVLAYLVGYYAARKELEPLIKAEKNRAESIKRSLDK